MDNNTFRPGGLILTEKAAEAAGLTRESKVLDIGCGNGTTLSFLKKNFGCSVYGADISEKAVKNARLAVPEAVITHSDAASLPYGAEEFDAVFMECTLTLISDPVSAIEEAFRVLKSEGILAISVITGSGPDLINEGAADPDKMNDLLRKTGFREIVFSDEKKHLTQFYVEILFEYGSLEAYMREAERILGGSVLNCGMRTADISYGLFICSK